jgi:hypothetical protein
MALSDKSLSKRLAKLGVSNFETVDDARQRQAEMLRRLERAGIDQGYYVGLDDCGPNYCGRLKCAEACWFGTRARRLREIAAVHQLFTQSPGPVYRVSVVRTTWERPFNELNRISIAAAKQLNRRAFDGLYNSNIIAVGVFKMLLVLKNDGPRWTPEIHQIVAGATKSDLYTAFSKGQRGNLNFIVVDPIENLGDAISSVLQCDLEGRIGTTPKNSHRAQFYNWLLRLAIGSRIIRYGCDRYFNKLPKQPRRRLIKIPKKRPYPYWLSRYQYGKHDWGCHCDICRNRKW